MAEAAGAVEAGHAVEAELVLQPEDARAFGLSGGVCSGLVEPNTATCGTPKRGGDVHQAGVVARQAARCGDQRDRVEQRGLAGEHAAGAGAACGDLVAQRGFAGRAEQGDGRAVGGVQRRARAPRSARPASAWPARTRRPARRPSSAPAPSPCRRRAPPASVAGVELQTRPRAGGRSRCRRARRRTRPSAAAPGRIRRGAG